LGDFGVYTAMKEAKTRTRITKGVFDYTAPEIIDAQSFNKKSDLWTIGTTLLDICTTSLYDVKTGFYHFKLNNKQLVLFY
jgi:hypothetical protein